MRLHRCETCRGVYPPVQPDGALYHHVCPPMRIYPDGRIEPRPDARDERLAYDEDGRSLGVRRPGRGVTALPDDWAPPPPPAPPPGILARLWARIGGRST